MADLPTVEQITSLSGLLAPGIIILWIRSRFRDATPPDIGSKAIEYVAVSVAYHAIVSPIFDVSGGITIPAWLWDLLFYGLAPAIIAGAFVFVDQKEWLYTIADKLKFRLAHHIPTAWEFTFRDRAPCYVLVHLSDGSSVAGAWQGESFASSTSGDRDLFVSQIWEQPRTGDWEVCKPSRSILICADSIRMIEFIEGAN